MRLITPTQLLEQIEMGAEVFPDDNPFSVRVLVGRMEFLCEFEDFTIPQRFRFEDLYRAKAIRFGYPGDFMVPPFFFRGCLNTRRTRI
jgi:hypothetical protein